MHGAAAAALLTHAFERGVCSRRSLSVSIALSLACFASGRTYNQSVAVTGQMDLEGNILDVAGLEGKIEVCKRKQLARLLVPASTLAVRMALLSQAAVAAGVHR